uniref:Uncharacterized protein n=1 Tax=Lepeophtheirus salmonis TaxID=72036 RepID=A0A0K2VKX2_LEPSM
MRQVVVESGGESILHDLWLHSWLQPQDFLRCELYVAYQSTGHPSKLLPLQIIRLFCELWILKVNCVDHKLGVICEKLLS